MKKVFAVVASGVVLASAVAVVIFSGLGTKTEASVPTEMVSTPKHAMFEAIAYKDTGALEVAWNLKTGEHIVYPFVISDLPVGSPDDAVVWETVKPMLNKQPVINGAKVYANSSYIFVEQEPSWQFAIPTDKSVYLETIVLSKSKNVDWREIPQTIPYDSGFHPVLGTSDQQILKTVQSQPMYNHTKVWVAPNKSYIVVVHYPA